MLSVSHKHKSNILTVDLWYNTIWPNGDIYMFYICAIFVSVAYLLLAVQLDWILLLLEKQDTNTILHICNGCHVLQVIGTAALLLCILALGDQRNGSLPDGLQPVLVGAAVLVIGVSMGSNSGYALNPARDFGPRFFTYIAGWGGDVFMLVASLRTLRHFLSMFKPSALCLTSMIMMETLAVFISTNCTINCLCRAGGGWWWVPIVAPCVGALLGTLIYQLMIEVHHPPSPSELQTSCQEATEGKPGLEMDGGEPDCVKPT